MGDGVWRLGWSAGSAEHCSAFRLAGPLFDEHMRIDAAEAEAVDGGATWLAVGALFPRLALRERAEGALGERDFVAGALEVGDGRKCVVAEGEENFQQARRARAGEQVADVRLHCAERALAGLPSAVGPELVQAGEFHGVADGCAGGVALDELDALRFPAGGGVGEAEGAELAFAGGRKEVAVEVVREADAADEGVDFVVVAEGVG